MALYDHNGPNLIEPHDLLSIQREQDKHVVMAIVDQYARTIVNHMISTPSPPLFFTLTLVQDVGDKLWQHFASYRCISQRKEHEPVLVCIGLESQLSTHIESLVQYSVYVQCIYHQNVYLIHCNWGPQRKLYTLKQLIDQSSSTSSSSSIFSHLPMSLFSSCIVS